MTYVTTRLCQRPWTAFDDDDDDDGYFYRLYGFAWETVLFFSLSLLNFQAKLAEARLARRAGALPITFIAVSDGLRSAA